MTAEGQDAHALGLTGDEVVLEIDGIAAGIIHKKKLSVPAPRCTS